MGVTMVQKSKMTTTFSLSTAMVAKLMPNVQTNSARLWKVGGSVLQKSNGLLPRKESASVVAENFEMHRDMTNFASPNDLKEQKKNGFMSAVEELIHHHGQEAKM